MLSTNCEMTDDQMAATTRSRMFVETARQKPDIRYEICVFCPWTVLALPGDECFFFVFFFWRELLSCATADPNFCRYLLLLAFCFVAIDLQIFLFHVMHNQCLIGLSLDSMCVFVAFSLRLLLCRLFYDHYLKQLK